MDLTEKTYATEKIFNGRIINLRVDKVELPDGTKSTRELVEHPGGVGIVAINENNQVFLVEQFRKPIEKAIIEIPAGKLDENEEPIVAAKRELLEEIGYVSDNIQPIGAYYASPGFCDEIIHLYLTTDLTFVGTQPDEGEFLNIFTKDLDEMYQEILKGQVIDGKTAIGILLAKQLLEKK